MWLLSRVTVLALLLFTLLAFRAEAWTRTSAATFAVLPAGTPGPEGLEVDSRGNVYVTTFGFTASGSVTTPGQLLVYDANGNLLRNLFVTGASPHLLGLRFHPTTGALLVCDFGSQTVLTVDPITGASTVFMTLPSPLPHPALGAALNDITFDDVGNVYVSDSFQGIVWKTSRRGGTPTVFVDSPLLRTTGVPPFGANGLRFNNEETALFVANTGDRTVIKIPVSPAGKAGTPEVFANSIAGADGLIIDGADNLWVVANQADEIVVVDPTGRAIAKLGDFGGVAAGTPIQMLFPASLRFSGGNLFVTNLALDLRLFNPAFATVDSEWAAQVMQYTVVKIPATIPPIAGLP